MNCYRKCLLVLAASLAGVACSDAMDDGAAAGSQEGDLVRTASAVEHISTGMWGDVCVIKGGEVRCAEPLSHGMPQFVSPRQISVGFTYACGLDVEGVKCWPSDSDSAAPDGLRNVTQVSVAESHACALADGAIRCWQSWNDPGQDPQVVEISNPLEIGTSSSATCARNAKEVKCRSIYGSDRDPMTEVPLGIKHPKQLAVGPDHACVLDDEGVKCWGHNDNLQTDVPKDLKNPTFVASGLETSCAITDEGVRCWGGAYQGNPNDLSSVVRLAPHDLKSPTSLAVNAGFACATTDDGLKCWGDRVSEHIAQDW